MRRRSPTAAAGLLVLALAVAGCGKSDEDEIRDTVDGVQQAFAAKDLQTACELTTRAAQRHVGSGGHDSPTTCARDLRKLAVYFPTGALHVGPLPRVVSVSVDGDRATARLRLGAAVTELPLVRDGGSWKLDALYGDIPAGEQVDRFP